MLFVRVSLVKTPSSIITVDKDVIILIKWLIFGKDEKYLKIIKSNIMKTMFIDIIFWIFLIYTETGTITCHNLRTMKNTQ